jgi:hypothetical protein
VPNITVTTDMGPWRTLPRRVRVGFLTELGIGVVVGTILGLGLASLAATLIGASCLSVAWLLAFDRRRAWWPGEPNVPVDPIGRHFRRWIVSMVAVVVITVVLVLTGVLQL